MTPRLTSPDGHYTLELNLQGGFIQRARFADFEIFYNAPWQSNGGRDYFPWNGRNYCVGIEPIASAFDLPSHGEAHALKRARSQNLPSFQSRRGNAP